MSQKKQHYAIPMAPIDLSRGVSTITFKEVSELKLATVEYEDTEHKRRVRLVIGRPDLGVWWFLSSDPDFERNLQCVGDSLTAPLNRFFGIVVDKKKGNAGK